VLTCHEVTELANDHLDREISVGSRLQIELHLVLCPPCRVFVRQIAGTIELVRHAEVPPPDPETERQLLSAFRGQPQPVMPSRAGSRK